MWKYRIDSFGWLIGSLTRSLYIWMGVYEKGELKMVKLEDELFIGSWEFMFCGPEITSMICASCNHEEDVSEEDELDECPGCGVEGDMVNVSSVESKKCEGCPKTFDTWDDYHVNDDAEYLCTSCYDGATVLYPRGGHSEEDVAKAMEKMRETNGAYKYFGE